MSYANVLFGKNIYYDKGQIQIERVINYINQTSDNRFNEKQKPLSIFVEYLLTRDNKENWKGIAILLESNFDYEDEKKYKLLSDEKINYSLGMTRGSYVYNFKDRSLFTSNGISRVLVYLIEEEFSKEQNKKEKIMTLLDPKTNKKLIGQSSIEIIHQMAFVQ